MRMPNPEGRKPDSSPAAQGGSNTLAMKIIRLFFVACLFGSATASNSVMMSNGYENESNKMLGFRTAVSALEREDWSAAIAALKKIIEHRDWDDDAHTLLGYAYRKLGNYDASLRSYRRALELNPNHRGALEYLGEAYLELGERDKAEKILQRLAAICKQQTPSESEDWRQRCLEWVELERAVRMVRQEKSIIPENRR